MRPIREEIAGLAPAQYSYDARGRLASFIRGTGPNARTNLYSYDASGNLMNIVDPLGRLTALEYDLAGRLTRATLPGDRIVQRSYDANGNLAGLSPPGRPVHSFSYSPVDLATSYAPPVAFPGTNSTAYEFDLDRQIVSVVRPDGLAARFDRMASGCNCDRLNFIAYVRGTNTFTYDPLTGSLLKLTAPDGVDLSFNYAGSLATQKAWNGAVNGSVSYAFDNDLDVVSRQVNSGSAVTLNYDADKLLTRAGDLTITRNPQNDLIRGSVIGGVNDSWNYDEFAEPTNYSAVFGAAPLYTFQFTRDAFGRITARSETIGGATTDYAYIYNAADRLTGVTVNGSTLAIYIYDANDNRLTATDPSETRNGTYDNQDRLL
jgi:YD repeat-containing protein